MLRRICLVLGVLYLSIIVACVYYIGFGFLFAFVLGVESHLFLRAGWWACILLAVGSMGHLFRAAWRVPAKPPVASGAQENTATEKSLGDCDPSE
jgi:hypothetical protein